MRAIERNYIKELNPYFNHGGEHERRVREKRTKVSALRHFLYAKENMAEVLQCKVQERFLLGDSQGYSGPKRLEELSNDQLDEIQEMVERFKLYMKKLNEEHEKLFE